MATKTLAGAAARTPANDPRESAGTAQPAKGLLLGAEACLAMLRTIDTEGGAVIHPATEADADVQAAYADQYKAVDAAVTMALNRYSTNAGFRMALGNYLLTIAQGAGYDPKTITAEGLLTDVGGRAPDTYASEVGGGTGTMEERLEIAASASYEIEGIAMALQRLDDTAENWFLMRGLFLRIEALNSVIMSVTSGGDEGREITEMREVLFGLHGRQQQEVSHG